MLGCWLVPTSETDPDQSHSRESPTTYIFRKLQPSHVTSAHLSEDTLLIFKWKLGKSAQYSIRSTSQAFTYAKKSTLMQNLAFVHAICKSLFP